MRKKLGYLILLLVLSFFAQAQRKITGKVTGTDNLPLSGVTVAVKDARTKTTTNERGLFSLSVPESGKLVFIFTHVGYEMLEVPAGSIGELNVTLKEVSSSLQDVVVVGYGTQRRRDLTGSVGSVNMAELNKAPVKSFDGALAGRIRGG